MKRTTQAALATAGSLILSGCTGLSDRANSELDRLDVKVEGVVEVLQEAPRLQLVIELADINRNGRIDSADEWLALVSGLVTAIAAAGE